MKKLLLILILNSCVTNYYFVNIDEDTTIYTSKKGTESIAVIPKGSGVYINTSEKKHRKIKWRDYKGWALNPVYSNTNMSDNSTNYNSINNSYNRSSSPTSSKILVGRIRTKS